MDMPTFGASVAAGTGSEGGSGAGFDPALLPPWDGDVAAARALQQALAMRVSLHDEVPEPLRLIAGVDVGFEDQGAITRAAVVLLDAGSLAQVEQVVARRPTAMPYIPGLLSFRELPAVLDALARLSRVPQLIFVDGLGIAHPRGLGIAAHLGVITGLPTIGVAKSILVGTHAPLGERRGDRVDLHVLAPGSPPSWPLPASRGQRSSGGRWVEGSARSTRLPGSAAINRTVVLFCRLPPPAPTGSTTFFRSSILERCLGRHETGRVPHDRSFSIRIDPRWPGRSPRCHAAEVVVPSSVAYP